ncbi:copper chaperone CopZ [Cohnella pontilimi]|uniref:Copper chaperone CopZ n=1 Tax=Cohnella pontilimi TaxID=2564100 RepID=A0A4U0F7P9_9BACL|nr:copper chaperone CopZ [Cohnella pontilimi]TJY40747.1 copper chaperone CopZ [Cohnella pontilimi]
MQSVTLQVKGMSCGHCVKSVEGAVKNLGGTAEVDLASGQVAVRYDDSQVKLEAIKEAIEDQGYDVV